MIDVVPDRPPRRVFILGAGFSKAFANLPLAVDLTNKLIDAAQLAQIGKAEWLENFQKRLRWFEKAPAARINVEQLFHYATFEIEYWKMQQQLCSVDRSAGTTPWGKAEDVQHTLEILEETLLELIWDEEKKASLDLTTKFARHLRPGDAIVTFNYDTLPERALTQLQIPWSHGLDDLRSDGVVVLKMHGSVDWIVLPRKIHGPSRLTKLFSKHDANADTHPPPANETEYHHELWRWQQREDCEHFIRHHELMQFSFNVGLAGLGNHKPLAMLPGSGLVWARADGALRDAEEIYVIGFSLSPFDAMARLHFGRIMMERQVASDLPRKLVLVDPNANRLKSEYESVFGKGLITPIEQAAQDVNWTDWLAQS